MNVLKGKQAVLSVSIDSVWTPVFCATSCSFRYDYEEVLKTSVNSGRFRERTTRLCDWEFAITGLTKIDNSDGQAAFFWLLQESVRGTTQLLRLRFVDDAGTEHIISGNCIVKQGQIDNVVGGFSTATQVFPGTGEFSQGSISGGVASDLYKLYLEPTEGAFEVSHADLGEALEIMLVLREEGGFKETSGTPAGREFKYTDLTSSGKLTFDTTKTFNPGEIVYVQYRK